MPFYAHVLQSCFWPRTAGLHDVACGAGVGRGCLWANRNYSSYCFGSLSQDDGIVRTQQRNNNSSWDRHSALWKARSPCRRTSSRLLHDWPNHFARENSTTCLTYGRGEQTYHKTICSKTGRQRRKASMLPLVKATYKKEGTLQTVGVFCVRGTRNPSKRMFI